MKLEEVLENITYAPGYRLSINEDGHIRRLILHAKVEDSHGVEKNPVNVSCAYAVPHGDLPERDWLKLIRFALISLAVHEVDEWLHYKGEIPWDPHT